MAADLIAQLELLAAWHKRGGPKPAGKYPSIYKTVTAAIDALKPQPVKAVRVNADGSEYRA